MKGLRVRKAQGIVDAIAPEWQERNKTDLAETRETVERLK